RAHLAVNQHKVVAPVVSSVAHQSALGAEVAPQPIGFYKPVAPVEDKVSSTSMEAAANTGDQVSTYLKSFGDSPACPSCGHLTIRSGACYKCMNCGTQTGCS
ncbi:MAG: hypothetical protein ACK49O_04420, partial [Bacteroidota bacterium]